MSRITFPCFFIAPTSDSICELLQSSGSLAALLLPVAAGSAAAGGAGLPFAAGASGPMPLAVPELPAAASGVAAPLAASGCSCAEGARLMSTSVNTCSGAHAHI